MLTGHPKLDWRVVYLYLILQTAVHHNWLYFPKVFETTQSELAILLHVQVCKASADGALIACQSFIMPATMAANAL